MLYKADLSEANLSGALIYDPEQLSNANLTNTNLSDLIVEGSNWLDKLQNQDLPPIGFEASMWRLEKVEKFKDKDLWRVLLQPGKSISNNSICS